MIHNATHITLEQFNVSLFSATMNLMMAPSTVFDLNVTTQIASLAVLIVVSLIVYHKKVYSYWKHRGIPGPKPLPFFGHTLHLMSKPLVQFDQHLISTYGNLVGTYNMTHPVLLVSDPDTIQEVTIKKFHSFVDRRDFNGDKLFTSMLTAANGSYWKRMRKLMSPTFSTGKIRAMSQLMKRPLERFLSKLDNRQEVNLKEAMYRTTLHVIVRTAFGVELSDGPECDLAVYHAIRALKVSPVRMFLGMFLPDFIKKWLQFILFERDSIEYFAKMADAMIDQRKNNSDQSREFTDFIDLMLEASDESNDKLTRLEVTANCLLILLAGYETTAITLTTLLFSLAHNQSVQERLRSDLKGITCEDANDLEANSSSLNYLDAVVKESLRINPPATRSERFASENVTLSSGLKIDTGTVVSFPIYAVHHNDKLWPDPETFNPDRFLPENKDKINSYAFIPFHSGPRNCIGERFALVEVKLSIIKIIKDFRLLPSPKTSYPLACPNSSVILALGDEVFVTFEKL